MLKRYAVTVHFSTSTAFTISTVTTVVVFIEFMKLSTVSEDSCLRAVFEGLQEHSIISNPTTSDIRP
jgi:hypothetical protein